MDIGKYVYLIYTVIHLIVLFALVPIKRIKQLWPLGLIAVLLLFAAQYMFLALHLLKYSKSIAFIAGMPLFQLTAVFPFGILLIYYIKEEWIQKIPVIFLFTLINAVELYLARLGGKLQFLDAYNAYFDLIFTFVAFCFGVWVAEGMFKDRIYNEEKS